MSVIRCTICTRFIDTDFGKEFYMPNSDEPYCENCLIEKTDGEYPKEDNKEEYRL